MVAATRSSGQYPGGFISLYAVHGIPLREVFYDTAAETSPQPRLLIVDEADVAARSLSAEITAIQKRDPRITIIVVGQRVPRLSGALVVNVGPLANADARSFAKRLGIPDERIAQAVELARGMPALLALVADQLGEGMSWVDVAGAFGPMHYSGILGPDGHAMASLLTTPQPIITAAAATNEELLRRLSERPEGLRGLPSRAFEELVAELMHRQGFDVELTPASDDGGFDIFAARSDLLGRFLFLVECKRYTPPNKVGVEIVRAVHGVVQQTRATAGVVVTTSFFTRRAEEFRSAVEHQLFLRDYVALQAWLSTDWESGRVGPP
jgi:restriction system protein